MKRDNQSTQSILLTGATGLIGGHLVPALDDYSPLLYLGRSAHAHRPSAFVPTDLSTDWDTAILPPKIDNIVYLAQSDYFRDFPDKAKDIFAVNTSSVLKLLEYARQAGVQRFIYASSGGVYGPSNTALNEESHLALRDNLGFYLSTKLCSEALLENYAAYMQIIILRFFFVYGPGQRKDMLIPRLIQRVHQELPLLLQGEDGLSLNPIYVVDAVSAIKHALQLTGSHKINIGGPDVLNLRQLGCEIAKQLGKKPIFKLENQEQSHLIADITRMKELLGSPITSFSKGLSNMNTANNAGSFNDL
jgi:UDP-glucose 4-epimerase